MSVFGQQSQTLTEMAKQLGHSDHLLKAQYRGSAPMDNSITAESWLPGTTGVHCNITHGDHWEEVKGATTVNIQNTATTIHNGDTFETYNSQLIRQHYRPMFEYFFALKEKIEFAPASYINTAVKWMISNKVLTGTAVKLSATGVSVGITGTDASLKTVSIKINSIAEFAFQNTTFDLRAKKWAVKAKEVDVKGLEWNVQLLMQEAGLVRNRANDLFFEIGETKATVGALDAGTTVNLKPYHSP